MIVSSRFDGDDWDELMWAMHDVYHEGIRILMRDNESAFNSAAILMQAQDDPIKDSLNAHGCRVDHRSLQNAHDYLAAVWRYRNRFFQPDLLIEDSVEQMAQNWLAWLQQEMQIWQRHFPQLVRLVCLIIVQQNVKSGYEAEQALQREMERIYRLGDA